MFFEVLRESRTERHENQRDLNNGQNRVGNQNSKINRADKPGPWKLRGPVMQVVIDIRKEKKRRRHTGGEHAEFVAADEAAPDEDKTEHEKDSADKIESGV